MVRKVLRVFACLCLSCCLLSSHITRTVSADSQKIGAFVSRLYRLCLDREPDAGGYQNWVNQLTYGAESAAQVVQSFFLSQEFKNKKLSNEETVTRCYRVMLDRNPDSGGLQSWTGALDTGVSVTFILKGFVGSDEFTRICKEYEIVRGDVNTTEARDYNLNLTAFVQRLYLNVLNRNADTGGLNNWCLAILAKTRSPKQVATDGFFNSAEYLNKKTSNEAFVTTCYKTFLNRNPEQSGFNHWLNILNSGNSRNSVLAGFAGSAEFSNIIKNSGWQAASDSFLAGEFTNVNSFLLLANKKHKLPSGYQPSDLRQPNTRATQTVYLRNTAAAALENMFAAAASQGVYLKAGSGFRSESLQATLYNNYVRQYGASVADTISSRPGYSDHQTGLAIDISDNNGATYLTQAFENTSEGIWLRNNAHYYGFIMRYPKGKDSITGYSYEPWHFRYVGVDYARAIRETDTWYTFEEYFNVSGGDYN